MQKVRFWESVPYDPLQIFLQNGHFVPYDPVPYDPVVQYVIEIVETRFIGQNICHFKLRQQIQEKYENGTRDSNRDASLYISVYN